MLGGKGDARAASLNRGRAGINTQSELARPQGLTGTVHKAPAPGIGEPFARRERQTLSTRLSALIERERVSGSGPAALAFAMALGAAQYAAAPREIAWAAILAVLVPAAIALVLILRAALLRACVWCALALAAGMLAAKVQVVRTDTVMMVGEATTRVTARVSSSTVDARGRTRYRVVVESTADPVLQFAPSHARIFVSAGHERLGVGARFEAVVRLRQPSGPALPGGYDFAFHNFFDGIGAQGFMLGRPRPIEAGQAASIGEHVASLRQSIASIVRASLPTGSGGVAAALLTGDRRGISEATTEALRASGLAHVLAISGLHMALVSGLVLASARASLAGAFGLASRVATRKVAAIVALVFATGYLLLSGASVSALRAYVMLAIMLVTIMCDRPALTMRNVGVAAIIVIAIEPHAVVGPGFQMSFGATAALVATYTWWRNVRSWSIERERWMPPLAAGPLRFMVGLAVTSLVAGAATGLFAAYHFHRVAPFSMIANLLAMPIVSLIVMPLVVLTALALPFGLEGLVLPMLGHAIDWVVAIAEWVSSWRAPFATGQMEPWRFMAGTLALCVLVLCRTRLKILAFAPIMVAACVPAAERSRLLVIADRGAQAAIVSGADLHVVAERASGFVTDQWMDAFVVHAVPADSPRSAWHCEGTACRAEIDALSIAYAWDYESIDRMCLEADLVLTPRRIRRSTCRNGVPIIGGLVTGQRGAALVPMDARFQSAVEQRDVDVLKTLLAHALPSSARPWTAHRHKTLVRRSERRIDRTTVVD